MFTNFLKVVGFFFFLHYCESLNVGDECIKGSMPGICQLEKDCEAAKLAMNNHAERAEFSRTKCGLAGVRADAETIVCCPTT